jgi:putative transposase
MISPEHKLSLTRQAALLGLSRSSLYYRPAPVPEADLILMRRMDELHLEMPFAGSRQLRDLLQRESYCVGRKHVTTLMRKMGIEALYRKPNTSKRNAAHRIYPYLLRGRTITQANQVWAMDITYIPMAKGFIYLCAVVDWASRKILSHRISITMETDFCIEALQEALARYGKPEIFNTDQGSQFTSEAFTQELLQRNIRISMDGKGCWRDNVFVERIWRSIKYEEVYLHAYESVSAAKAGISRYIDLYNRRRPHSSLDKKTPHEFYYETLQRLAEAA